MKLEMVIPNIVSISEPAIANTVSNAAAVMMAIFETAFLSFFSIFSVRAINRGTLPMGSITTKRAIVDLIKFSKKSGGITNTGNDNADDADDDNDNNNISMNVMYFWLILFSECILICYSTTPDLYVFYTVFVS